MYVHGQAARLVRRRFLAGVAAGVMGASQPVRAQSVDPWVEADAIARGVALPSIPARSYPITGFGAVGNGITDCTAAIRRAFNAARAAGGGRVVVPAGNFLTGALSLYSKTGLHLEAGAVLRFKSDPAAYLPAVLTRFGGVDCYNYRPLIQAFGRRNVAITGSGVIEGGGDNSHWWPWKGETEFGWSPGQPTQDADILALRAQNAMGVPVTQRIYGSGHYLRPSLIQAYGCAKVLIDGVTIRHAPWWMVHTLFSTDITVRNVTFDSLGPNNDGCDLECSSDILIESLHVPATGRQGRGQVGLRSRRHPRCPGIEVRTAAQPERGGSQLPDGRLRGCIGGGKRDRWRRRAHLCREHRERRRGCTAQPCVPDQEQHLPGRHHQGCISSELQCGCLRSRGDQAHLYV